MGPGVMEKKNNVLPLWGNEKTMNLNNMILTNILSSHYFKVNLYQLKTYHEVVDEIYYNVSHLEPWEKGSRKTSGQTGMCGGVRGVGAGGIVSTAFCILYKLFTLKLTRKQLVGLISHHDSPYIRGLGFMYIRYTQPPPDLWEWYEPYLDDDEELDVKAGGGQVMVMGEVLRHLLSKLEWFSTLFPRIPVPIQKELERKLATCNPLVKGRTLEQSGEGNYQEEFEPEEPVATRQASSSHSSTRHREEREGSRRRTEQSDERYRETTSRQPSHRHHSHHSSRDRSRSKTRSNSETDRHHHHRSERPHSSHHRSSRHRSSRDPGSPEPGSRDRRHHRSRH